MNIKTKRRIRGCVLALSIACGVSMTRAEPIWSWSFSPDVVAIPHQGYIYGKFSSHAGSTEDLHLGGAPVSELPGNGDFFVPELGTRIVFTSVPSSTVLRPGESVVLPVFLIAAENPAASPTTDATYFIQATYVGSFGSGGPEYALTSRVADLPLTLTVSGIPESNTLALFLVGLALLGLTVRSRTSACTT